MKGTTMPITPFAALLLGIGSMFTLGLLVHLDARASEVQGAAISSTNFVVGLMETVIILFQGLLAATCFLYWASSLPAFN